MDEQAMDKIIEELMGRDEKAAFALAQRISVESATSDCWLHMIPAFCTMLESQNAYQRTRAFLLICSQAHWDENGAIDRVFGRMLPLLNDPKPTVVRQCLGALQEVVLFRPELHARIETAVHQIKLDKYKDSMSPLIQKDMNALLKMLE